MPNDKMPEPALSAAASAAAAAELKPVPFGSGHTLVGHDYPTPDLLAKVTGRSKYAEDFRGEGMLFCKLVLSPTPHGRIRRLGLDRARALPGVKAILTADDMPAQADYLDDNGHTIKANPHGERALTNEPMFEGDPILAIAAVDEETAAAAAELIDIDWEELPFVLDPLESLRPGGADARAQGNVWAAAHPGAAPELARLKWTEADFASYQHGQLPIGHAPDEWAYGDLEGGFQSAALVLDETFYTPDVSHICLEARSAMAYWQNGKLVMHTGTQSTYQTVPAIARWLNLRPEQVVLISEYTGGGFGSKVTAGITCIIPAVLSRRLNVPVMMRLSREDETYVGRARPGFQGRMRIGFARDGRIQALDMFVVCNCGPYGAVGDPPSSGRIVSLLYQPQSMRWRAVSALTNTPTRSAQSSPGGLQGIAIIEPILAKAARQLGLDQVALRRVNCPEGKAELGPVAANGRRAHATSCFLKQALDAGAEQFHWRERVARQPRRIGAKVRGVGVSLSCYVGGTIGFDGLIVITPQGRVRIHTGIGNLGTESVMDVHRAAAEALGVPWSAVDIVWGDTSLNLPYSCVSGGSQTTHAMTRAAHAVGTLCRERLQALAAAALGGSPASYQVAGQQVNGPGGSFSFAQAAQRAIQLGGAWDGHVPPTGVHKWTRAAVAALAGQGLVVAATDQYPHDGLTHSYTASFAEVEVDTETGVYKLVDFLVYGDVGTVVHPRALGGQLTGRSTLGIAHAIGQKWVYDPHYGKMVAKRFYQNKPPTILDVPVTMQWNAVNIPDPETPVGARGVGEPPVGGGCAAVLNALSDALGDEIFQRAPVNADTILTSFEAGRPMQQPLTAFI